MKITKIVFEKSYPGEYRWIKMSDIPKEALIPENKIMIHVEQGYNDSNGWNEGETTIQIAVEREQTQQEKDEMRRFLEERKIQSKNERYEEYLKLKKEFEN